MKAEDPIDRTPHAAQEMTFPASDRIAVSSAEPRLGVQDRVPGNVFIQRVIHAQRQKLLELRDSGAIDIALMQRLDRDLDREELRLRGKLATWISH